MFYAKTLFLKKDLKNEEIRKIPFTDFPEYLFDVRIFILSREKNYFKTRQVTSSAEGLLGCWSGGPGDTVSSGDRTG